MTDAIKNKEGQLKQSDDPSAFYEKYGFTSSQTKRHPKFNDEMRFDGLESDYVNRLESRVRDLEKYIQIQNDKIDFLMTRDLFKWRRLNQEERGPIE